MNIAERRRSREDALAYVRNTLADFKNIPLDTEYQMWKWLANIGIAKGTAQVIDLQRECPANGFRPLIILRFK